jgi:hypothetical protein
VSLLVLNQNNELKSALDLGITYHEERDIALDLSPPHEILQSLADGDQVGVWAISAPYGGYECVVTNAVMSVYGSFNWRRRANMMLFLYNYRYLSLTSAPPPPPPYNEFEEQEAPTSGDLVRDAVLGNPDLSRLITSFI